MNVKALEREISVNTRNFFVFVVSTLLLLSVNACSDSDRPIAQNFDETSLSVQVGETDADIDSVVPDEAVVFTLSGRRDLGMIKNILHFYHSKSVNSGDGWTEGSLVFPVGSSMSVIETFGPFTEKSGYKYASSGGRGAIGWGVTDAATALVCVAKMANLDVNVDSRLKVGIAGLPSSCGKGTDIWVKRNGRNQDVSIYNNTDSQVTIHFRTEKKNKILLWWTTE